jgi:VWFA-related protein
VSYGRQWIGLVVLCLTAALAFGQPQNQGQSDQKQQNQSQSIPDAPSATRPPQSFPSVPPSPAPPPPAASEQTPPNDESAPPRTSGEEPSEPPAMPPVTTVPPGTAPPGSPESRDQIYKLVVVTNQVVVPVTVKDYSGRMVDGLLPKDFAVYDNGQKQKMNFFTSDPFPLSAAVILDLGMPDVAVQKVNQTFPALEGAFSQFDEVSLFTYSSSVTQMTDFAAVGRRLTGVLNGLQTVSGHNNGPPVVNGPFGPQGPTVNGVPVDPTVPHVSTPPRESHVLNDAILAAALDLSKRDKTRRKIIFIISDGREIGSRASYSDVLKVLLSNGITVYAVGTDASAIPGYSRLQKLHLPRMGYSDILPKYVSATGGGEVYKEFSRQAIESAYSRAMGDARNQYTVGYVARASAPGVYHQIEVRVDHPDLKVFAKDGYYQLPPAR